METRVVVVHEDRDSHLPGLVLVLNSIIRNTENTKIIASHNSNSPDFRQWLTAQNIDSLCIQDDELSGWNIKAKVVQHLLRSGYQEVIWVDADILVMNDFLDYFDKFPSETIIATEETYWGQMQGGSVRTEFWGLTPGRELSRTVNTGVLRLTSKHLALVDRWCEMLAHPVYKQVQAMPWYERPMHMVGDQEVFTALVCSTEADHFPLYQLRSGIEIAQCFGPAGFTLKERFKGFFQQEKLYFVHAMGHKPWLKERLLHQDKVSARQYYDFLHLETCPYTLLAKNYQVGFVPVQWFGPSKLLSRLLRIICNDSIYFTGLPLAVVDTVVRYARRVMGLGRYNIDNRHRVEL